MDNFKKQLDTILKQKQLIELEFLELYPYHKLDVENPEIQNMFNNTEYNLEENYYTLNELLTNVSNAIREKEKKLNALNNNIDKTKQFYNENKPKLQNIIDESESGLPRENQFQYKLQNQYYNLGYNTVLIVPMIYLLYTLLHS